MTRVLVTGGLGGSGRWIVDRLASDGAEVMCVDQRGAESERETVDVRDIAGIVAAALEADVTGHEPVFAAAADTYADRPVVDLIREYFGEAPDDVDIEGDDSAVSTARARELLDWSPRHSWRDAAEEAVPEPQI